MVGRNAEVVGIGLDIPRERIFPAKGIQKLLEDALTTAEFGRALPGLMGMKQLQVVQKCRFQMLNCLPVIRTVDNLLEKIHIMLHSLEIIFLQAQPGAFLEVYRQAAEGQHLPVIVIGKRGDADVVVLRDDQHITRLSLEG